MEDTDPTPFHHIYDDREHYRRVKKIRRPGLEELDSREEEKLRQKTKSVKLKSQPVRS